MMITSCGITDTNDVFIESVNSEVYGESITYKVTIVGANFWKHVKKVMVFKDELPEWATAGNVLWEGRE